VLARSWLIPTARFGGATLTARRSHSSRAIVPTRPQLAMPMATNQKWDARSTRRTDAIASGTSGTEAGHHPNDFLFGGITDQLNLQLLVVDDGLKTRWIADPADEAAHPRELPRFRPFPDQPILRRPRTGYLKPTDDAYRARHRGEPTRRDMRRDQCAAASTRSPSYPTATTTGRGSSNQTLERALATSCRHPTRCWLSRRAAGDRGAGLPYMAHRTPAAAPRLPQHVAQLRVDAMAASRRIYLLHARQPARRPAGWSASASPGRQQERQPEPNCRGGDHAEVLRRCWAKRCANGPGVERECDLACPAEVGLKACRPAWTGGTGAE
jgi:hypothetical protein